MNFDPIKFERASVRAAAALALVQPFVAHTPQGPPTGRALRVEAGDVDLTPILQSLVEQGYRGNFSVEYEGSDGTLRLYESVWRVRAVIEAFRAS